ncbi:MAG: hypothetical protein CMJ89_18275 [Planctomycetes bacterium]|jgi:type III pantothenate kinase|nr:hypothetical protein [Planctomycetota bacterium]
MLDAMLTVDLGNSRTKARLWRGRELCVRAEFETGDVEGLARWLERNPVACVALSSVADGERTDAVGHLLKDLAIRFVLAPDSGLVNRTRRPERVGLDRLYAARGALAELGSSAIVCDLGTALTVDAVFQSPRSPDASGAGGDFLGGAIAPGPELCARVLEERTARLPRVTPTPGARALGRDTEEAIAAGCAVGIRGAARALVEGVAREADLVGAPVALTGGAARFLLEPQPFLERNLHPLPELVHRGLLEAAQTSFEAT